MMMKRSTVIFIVLFLVAAVGARWFTARLSDTTVWLKGVPLRVLVADTPLHRFRGLGRRDALAPYDGMIFLFPEAGQYGFVMRDMRFPIDIVWVAEGVVVDIAQDVSIQPDASEFELSSYFPRIAADTVLELPAGWAAAHRLGIGDIVADSP
jgi:hypothetical protein